MKLMASYLLVVALVALPTFLYIRTGQQRDLRANVQGELEIEVQRLAEQLGSTPTDRFAEVMQTVLGLYAERVTLIDPEGHVLRDSRAAAASMENHRDRPEVRGALDRPGAVVSASRRSATTGETFLYSAMAFPTVGASRGIVRLALPMAALDATEQRGTLFIYRAAALALSAAVLLSLVAAIVVSRPLRRIAEGARAFADGDFGYPIQIHSNDELGDAAGALRDLAAQLRDRLVSAGADRATLHVLLDHLPIGVVLYSAARVPVALNGRARELCDLHPSNELARAAEIIALPAQALVVGHVLSEGLAAEVALRLPWIEGAPLPARWIALYSSAGERHPALLLLDGAPPRIGCDAVFQRSEDTSGGVAPPAAGLK